MKHASIIGISFFIAVVAIAAGCATTPLHTEASSSGIRAAEEVGANSIPRAALYLQYAKEELEHAKKLAHQDEKEQAASMLLRSEADAELAVALSREDSEKNEAKAAMDSVRQLRHDNP